VCQGRRESDTWIVTLCPTPHGYTFV
jgi:hypothetical protein